jgi:hypothetical protein
MNRITRRQSDGHVSLERLAVSARRQLIQAVNSFLRSFVDAKTLAASVDSDDANSRRQFDSENQRFCDVANALTLWHSSDAFLATNGSPAPLPMSGKRSLHSLAKEVASSPANVRRLVSDLVQFGLVDESEDMFRPARRSAIVGKANALNLAYATITATRLLQTISHNLSGGPPRLYERQVSGVTIRAEDLPMYLRFIEEQAQYLIDSADDWLARRRVGKNARSAGIKVGMGAFAWADLPAGRTVRSKPRAMRESRSRR